MPDKYKYECTIFQNPLCAMVKRTDQLNGKWDEAEMFANEIEGMNEEQVIQAAIKRESWA